MRRTQREWEKWFKRCMVLDDTGFLPSEPNFRNVCPSSEVVARWGPKRGAGYAFREFDGERYRLYVEELFCRVHQRAMVDDILPLHFARGLLEESRGSPVNWATFAIRRCFPRHKRTPFEPWPEYANVRGPLPWSHPKVLPLPAPAQGEAIPRTIPQVTFSLSLTICNRKVFTSYDSAHAVGAVTCFMSLLYSVFLVNYRVCPLSHCTVEFVFVGGSQ